MVRDLLASFNWVRALLGCAPDCPPRPPDQRCPLTHPDIPLPDWVAREGSLRLEDPIPFAAGLAETVAWYREARWLPPGPVADRRAPSSRTSQ